MGRTLEETFTTEKGEKGLIVRMQISKIDMFNVPEIRTFFNGQLKSKPNMIVLDLSKTAFMDSSAMGYLFKLHREMESYGGKLCLTFVQKKLNQLLTLNGANKYFAFYDTVEDAFAAD